MHESGCIARQRLLPVAGPIRDTSHCTAGCPRVTSTQPSGSASPAGAGDPEGDCSEAVVCWSGSGTWVLGAAARSACVAAVAAYEPFVTAVMGEDDFGRTFSAMEQMGTATADGRLVDALRVFAPWICTDEEVRALRQTDFFEHWAGAVPAMLRFVQQDKSYAGVRPTDPEELARVSVPVLLLRGEQTRFGTFFADAAHLIAQHVPEPQVCVMPGVGHFAPLLEPEAVADELITFFDSVRQPA